MNRKKIYQELIRRIDRHECAALCIQLDRVTGISTNMEKDFPELWVQRPPHITNVNQFWFPWFGNNHFDEESMMKRRECLVNAIKLCS